MNKRMVRGFAVACILAVSLLAIWQPVGADGVIIVEPPICDPACPGPVFIDDQLEVQNHKVDVVIENQVATTSVDQTFFNPNDWVAEGTYIFPVPANAAVSDFVMVVDGEPVEATLLDADEARAIYENIVRNMRDPALLEYVGQNLIQARVFPIQPGDTARIQIEYQQVLTVEDGIVRYSYPLSTERFSAAPLDQASVHVDVSTSDPVRAVYSPSHSIAVNRENDTHFSAGWESTDVLPDTNFELIYTLADAPVGASVLSTWDAAEEIGTYLMLVSPGIGKEREAIAKDVVLVLDTSGSMAGDKIEQAREALTYVLNQLGPEDRFTVVDFSTGVRLYDSELLDTSEVPGAVKWVSRLDATGGTDIDGALETAVDLVDHDRPTYLLFLTDGVPTEGETEIGQITENVESSIPDNVRLFSFGVGDDVDTILLDTLSSENHGATTYVRPGDSLDDAIATFYSKISTPVLTDVEIEVDGVDVEDIYPQPLPDLFAGTQLVIAGRYREGGDATVSVSGMVDGERQTYVYEGQTFVSSNEPGRDDTLPRIWATRKIGYLLNQIRIHGENEEWIAAIVDLSVKYGIVTPYTSYLITDEDVLTAEGRQTIADEAYATARDTEPETTGSGAVDAAEAAGSLADADIAAPVATAGADGGAVRIVGSRAFVLQVDTWIETTFDPDMMETEKVEFLSDEYFDLLQSHPDLAEAFALGDKVIALSDGIAYEVTN